MKTKSLSRITLGAFLVGAGIAHLTLARRQFRAQVPDWVPLDKDDTVVYSGIAEIALGTANILAPKSMRKTTAVTTAAFFTAIFPGNMAQYYNHRDAFGLNNDNARLARLFLQPLLIYWALKSDK